MFLICVIRVKMMELLYFYWLSYKKIHIPRYYLILKYSYWSFYSQTRSYTKQNENNWPFPSYLQLSIEVRGFLCLQAHWQFLLSVDCVTKRWVLVRRRLKCPAGRHGRNSHSFYRPAINETINIWLKTKHMFLTMIGRNSERKT